ncbi:MAG: PRC-barrel domain-containing protein, partial [Acidobacteria bacterium]|nr:PRC-barrel domain-containing protein [Acidobacteriota bacterium]
YQPELSAAQQLIGMQIQNNQGQTLGSLEDIVLEPGLNYVAYGVLSRGGVLGMGQNYFAIPWDVLQLSSDRHNLILNIPEQAFEQAQGFNKDRWPDRADQRWRMQAMGQQPMTPAAPGESWREQQHREQQQWRQQPEQSPPQAMSRQPLSSSEQLYGRAAPQKPESESEQLGQAPAKQQWGAQQGAYRNDQQGFNFRRVSHLLGLNVETIGTQQKVGDLKDLVLDFQQGLVAYGIVSLQGGRSAPVPWSAIEIQPMNRLALVDADLATLDKVAYEGNRLPDLSNSQYAQSIYNQFNREPYWEVFGFAGGLQPRQQAMPQSMQQPMSQQQPMEDPLTQHFDPQNVTAISGTVESIDTFDEPALGLQGQRLRIKTNEGQTLSVHVGPRGFIEQQGLMLRRNEPVQVRGSYATFKGHSIFIASDIRTQQAEVQLRDQHGMPLWTTTGMPMPGRHQPQY